MRSPLAVVVVLCAASCGSSPARSSAAAGYRKILADAQCDVQVRCGAIGAAERKDCAALAYRLVAQPVSYDQLIDANHITFDGDAAAACLVALRQAECSPQNRSHDTDVCNRVFVGKQKEGEACVVSAECASGYCRGALLEGCPGHCGPYAAVGDSCAAAECDPTTAVCSSKGSLCAALGKQGDGCVPAQGCLAGLACVLSGGLAHLCQPLLGAGQPCRMSPALCPAGQYCSSATSTCQPNVGAGVSCDFQTRCASGLVCAGGPVGDQFNRGTCTPWLDVGATCAYAPGVVSACPADSVCDQASSTCQRPAGADYGAACTEDGECRSGLCDAGTEKCIAPLDYQAHCTPPPPTGHDPCLVGTCDTRTRRCTLRCQ